MADQKESVAKDITEAMASVAPEEADDVDESQHQEDVEGEPVPIEVVDSDDKTTPQPTTSPRPVPSESLSSRSSDNPTPSRSSSTSQPTNTFQIEIKPFLQRHIGSQATSLVLYEDLIKTASLVGIGLSVLLTFYLGKFSFLIWTVFFLFKWLAFFALLAAIGERIWNAFVSTNQPISMCRDISKICLRHVQQVNIDFYTQKITESLLFASQHIMTPLEWLFESLGDGNLVQIGKIVVYSAFGQLIMSLFSLTGLFIFGLVLSFSIPFGVHRFEKEMNMYLPKILDLLPPALKSKLKLD